jgi:hypothetical protein
MGVRVRLAALTTLAGLALAAPARAELVLLASGRTMSAAGVTFDGTQATIRLRGGGEVTCDRSLVVRVDPDETPWVDPNGSAGPATGAAAEGGAAQAAALPMLAPPPIRIPAAYDALITRLAAAHGVDARLVHAVIMVESAYQPRARSRKGARGLMQLMPATARQYGVRNAYHAPANVEAGIKHLRTLLDHFAPREAIAAYNAGEAAVRRFGGVPPFPETQAYVDRVLALAGLAASAASPPAPGHPGS